MIRLLELAGSKTFEVDDRKLRGDQIKGGSCERARLESVQNHVIFLIVFCRILASVLGPLGMILAYLFRHRILH